MSIARKIGNLGTALDSAALSTFLSKGTTDGEFDTIAWGDVTGKPSYIDSSLATQLFDSAYVQLRQSTVSSGGLDSAAVTSLIDSNYVAARATAATSSGFVMYNYNATSGQTAFQDSDTAGNVLSYTADGILVYYNGLLLADEDYTATDGAAVTLTEGADSGAQITIGKWNLTGSGGSSGGSSPWYGDRGIFGSIVSTNVATSFIDYIDLSTTGNATDFGDMTDARGQGGAVSNETYGVFAAGYSYGSFYTANNDRKSNVIDYITIATAANATSFGDLTDGRYGIGAVSDGTYGLFAGGYAAISSLDQTTLIDYITIATPSNATSFGDLTERREQTRQGASDGTYGVFGGGLNTVRTDTMDYVTIASPGNATDFGNLTIGKSQLSGASDNATYGFFMGGLDTSTTRLNVIEYITIATPGNASDFGDLTLARFSVGSTSNESKIVCAGGANASNVAQNIIDYFSPVTPTNASDFGDLTVTARDGCATSGSPS